MFHKFLSSGLYSKFRQIPKGQNFRVCVNLCSIKVSSNILKNFQNLHATISDIIVVRRSTSEIITYRFQKSNQYYHNILLLNYKNR